MKSGLLAKWLVSLLLVTLAAIAVVIWLFKLPEAPRAESNEFVLRNITLINPMISREKVSRLAVKGNQISLAKDETQIVHGLGKYDGMYVLPGLVNMHSHSVGKNLLNLSPMFSLAAVMHGVTTWRDAIDADGTGVPVLREQLSEGVWPTPDVISCAVVNKGKSRWPNSNIVERTDEIPALVSRIKRQGHDCIKSYESLSIDMIAQIKRSATQEDMQVIGHVPEGLSIEQAWLLDTQHFFGVQTEHQHGVVNRNGNWLSVDSERIEEVAERVVKRGMINTPTLVTLKQLEIYRGYEQALDRDSLKFIPGFYSRIVWHPQKGLPVYRNLDSQTLDRAHDALAKKQQLLKSLHDKGATLNVGTDTQQPFVVPGVAMWQEMRLFEQAGIPSEEVWAHATWKSHKQLPGDRDGLVVDGAPATFLIFEDDPTQSLDALDSLKAVVLRGQIYDIEELKRSMGELQSHYESKPVAFVSQFFVARAMEKIARKFTH